MGDDDELLEPKEVARILRVGYRKVLQMIADGEIEFVQVGNLYRIRRSVLDDYIRRHTMPPRKEDQD